MTEVNNNVKVGGTTIDFSQIKGGTRVSDLDEKSKLIFSKLDKDEDGVLSQKEIDKMIEDLTPFMDHGKITNREMKQYIAKQGLQNVTAEDMTAFVQEMSSQSANRTEKIVQKELGSEAGGLTQTVNEDGSITYADKYHNRTAFTYEETQNGYIYTVYDQDGNVKKTVQYQNGLGTTEVRVNEDGSITITREGAGVVNANDMIVKETKSYADETHYGVWTKSDYNGNTTTFYQTEPNGKWSATAPWQETTAVQSEEAETPADEAATDEEITAEETEETDNANAAETSETEENPEAAESNSQDTKARLQEAFGEDGVATNVTIDGKETGISSSDYEGELRLPQGDQLEDGKFPQALYMTLPDAYEGRVMKLTLVNPEDGVYESSAKDRQFKLEIGEDGSIKMNAVITEELTERLNNNLESYRTANAAATSEAGAAEEASEASETDNTNAADSTEAPEAVQTPANTDRPVYNAENNTFDCVPLKDSDPPQDKTYPAELFEQKYMMHGLDMKQADGSTWHYNDKGYVDKITSSDGLTTTEIHYDKNNNVESFRESIEYDNYTRIIERDEAGEISSFWGYWDNYHYDDRTASYKKDGRLSNIYYEDDQVSSRWIVYDSNNNPIGYEEEYSSSDMPKKYYKLDGTETTKEELNA